MALVKVKNKLGRVVVKNDPSKKPKALPGVSPATVLETPRAFRKQERSRGQRMDVESGAVLLEWKAAEHAYKPKSSWWFAAIAAGTTAVAGLLVILGNVFGAIVVALIGGTIYYLAQHKPRMVRFRIMVDGVAINNRLYPYQELDAFNVQYEPGEVKTVLVKSKKRLAPMINLEIGEADPVEIRERLLEFLPEDLEMEEPLADSWARRFGF